MNSVCGKVKVILSCPIRKEGSGVGAVQLRAGITCSLGM